jgi:hypothetical protein
MVSLIKNRAFGVPSTYHFKDDPRNHILFNDIWYNIRWEEIGNLPVKFELVAGFPSYTLIVG